MDFAALYQQTYDSLGVRLRAYDGCTDRDIAASEKLLDIRLPPALRTYFEIAGRERQLNGVYNHLLPPDEWFIDGGHLAFMEENQSVVFWGTPTNTRDDDPPVFQGVNGEQIEWYPEHERCSEFLVVMLHWQAVMGGFERTWSAVVDMTLLDKLNGWSFAGKTNELRAYSRDGIALCFVPWDDGLRIFATGADPKRVDAIADELSIEWDTAYE